MHRSAFGENLKDEAGSELITACQWRTDIPVASLDAGGGVLTDVRRW